MTFNSTFGLERQHANQPMTQLGSRHATRKRNERGEGVISLAIGVLIMAFLGAGMWIAFSSTMDKAQVSVDEQVTQIGG